MLDGVARGDVSVDAAVDALRRLPYADVDGALVDHHRAMRQGMPEAVFAPGKSPEQCVRIVAELLDHGSGPVLLTRASDDQRDAVEAKVGSALARGGSLLWRPAPRRTERVIVATAGTSDHLVADECELTLEAYGFAPNALRDVGVSGLHRLLDHLDPLLAADAVVVIAGMEGALPSVIGGLVSVPVVAVPTSVGYGAGLDGITALLAMHASCVPGISVVGIDNGYGAACAVARALPARR